MKISGLVVTFNEENNIGKCIDALLKVCDEVIIIDSLSTDKTVEIAKNKGALVVSQSYLGDGPQRIFGLDYCNNDWILNLDADEFLDRDAVEFIKSGVFFTNPFDAYSFRVKNFLQDKLINFAGWYPDSKIRFFNKKTAKPSIDVVHQKIVCSNLKKLKSHILHYGSNSFLQIISKKNQYAEWNAKQLFDNGKRIKIYKPILNGTISFVRCYFFKRGILNGIDGLTFSLIQGFFSYMKYANLLQIQKEYKKKLA